MRDVFESTSPLLDIKKGIACWVIGDVKGLNLAEEVWMSVGSKIQFQDANGRMARLKLLGIVEDEIKDVEKVTRIWKSDTDKSGKATPTDRILIVAHEDSEPEIVASNESVKWEMFEVIT